jgi:hypothetical protein
VSFFQHAPALKTRNRSVASPPIGTTGLLIVAVKMNFFIKPHSSTLFLKSQDNANFTLTLEASQEKTGQILGWPANNRILPVIMRAANRRRH